MHQQLFVIMKATFIVPFLFMVACSPKFKIQTDTLAPGDFSSYKSFKFYNPQNMPATNFSFEEDDKKVIYSAIADEFQMRGYNSIQDADLMIKIQGGTKSSVEIQNDDRFYNSPYGMYGYDRYGRYYDPYDRRRDESKKDAIIIIDLIDTKKDAIIWQGVAHGSLNKNESLTEIQIREAIANIFKEYPSNVDNSK